MKMNAIEIAIARYAEDRSEENLRKLDVALVDSEVLVPVIDDVIAARGKDVDVPVICLRTSAGDGAIPAFTSVEHILNWKPEGCKYVALRGKALLQMAVGMPQISEVVINVDGTPRGAIPRSEFERLISLD